MNLVSEDKSKARICLAITTGWTVWSCSKRVGWDLQGIQTYVIMSCSIREEVHRVLKHPLFEHNPIFAKSKPTNHMSQGWWISDWDKRGRGSGKQRTKLGLSKKQQGEDTPYWGKETVWACPRENRPVQGPQGRKGRWEEAVLGSWGSQRGTTSSITERPAGGGAAGGGSSWNLRQ